MTCAFRPTRHAKLQMIERGISRGEAEEAIARGVKLRRGPKILTRLRGIEVVYQPRKCNNHVITLHRR